LKPVGEDFGDPFDGRVLEGDRPKVLSLPGIVFFGKKNKVGLVNMLKIGGVIMKGFKQGKDFRGGDSPGGFEKVGVEPIRAKAGIRVLVVESMVNLRASKGGVQMSKGQGPLGIDVVKVELPPDVPSTT
jgi:hypothetical protein